MISDAYDTFVFSSGERDKASEAERDVWFETITQACFSATGENGGTGDGSGGGRNLSPALLSTQVSVLTSLLKRMVREMTDLSQVGIHYVLLAMAHLFTCSLFRMGLGLQSCRHCKTLQVTSLMSWENSK